MALNDNDCFALSKINNNLNMQKSSNSQMKVVEESKYESIIELLYLIRPVAYVVLLLAFKKNPKISFFTSLAFDLLIFSKEAKVNGFKQQKLSYYESKYRKFKLYAYLLRDPVYSSIVKPILDKMLKLLRIPQTAINIIELVLGYLRKLSYIV